MVAPIGVAMAATMAAAQDVPARYSVTIDGVAYRSENPPSFQVARGSAQGTAPANDLLAFVPDDPKSRAGASISPQPGFHQAIADVGVDDAITVLVSAGAEIPVAGGRSRTVVNLMVQGVTKNRLSALPLTAPVSRVGQPPQAGPSALVRASHNGRPYEGISGEVVIEAIDFAARSVRGRFMVTTGPSITGGQGPLRMTDGRFSK